MNQAERKFALSIFIQGGHGPFRGRDAPFSAVASLMVLRTEVNRIAENGRAHTPAETVVVQFESSHLTIAMEAWKPALLKAMLPQSNIM